MWRYASNVSIYGVAVINIWFVVKVGLATSACVSDCIFVTRSCFYASMCTHNVLWRIYIYTRIHTYPSYYCRYHLVYCAGQGSTSSFLQERASVGTEYVGPGACWVRSNSSWLTWRKKCLRRTWQPHDNRILYICICGERERHLHMYIFVFVGICMHMPVYCMHVYIYIYIYTHVLISTLTLREGQFPGVHVGPSEAGHGK